MGEIPLLELRGIEKYFPGVWALKHMSFTVRPGSVHVICGENGAGKSTLINRLVPDAQRSTGEVNEVTGRGRHTSSSAIALRCLRLLDEE